MFYRVTAAVQRLWPYLLALTGANLALLLPAGHPLRLVGVLLLLGLLPGLGWATRLLPTEPPLLRWMMAVALSYGLTLLTALFLHYRPGPITTTGLLLSLNGAALLPLIFQREMTTSPAETSEDHNIANKKFSAPLLPLLIILLMALLLRVANLHYSEFQGDEALAMISAAEALEGHEDALFLRSKGPGEVLLPLALWRLTGVINETAARLPFTLAALGSIVTIYLIGRLIGGPRLGWLAAAFFSLNGFTVAFGRIVQYQALVLWFSSLAFLLLLLWQQTGRRRLAFLSGLCLGLGLLAHYDAILLLPALAWLLLTTNNDDRRTTTNHNVDHSPYVSRFTLYVSRLTSLLLFLLGLLLTSLPFYLPYSLDPQANRTGAYVGGRIGSDLRNNLPDFFHFNSFYSSFYYILFTGLLVFILLLWLLGRRRWGRWVIAPVGLTALAVIFRPDLLAFAWLDLSFLPFALLLGSAFLALPFAADNRQALIIWLAVPFLGYNFVVALGLTHIYTTAPAWSLLAALGWERLSSIRHHASREHQHQTIITNYQLPITAFFLLSVIFLWNAFVRHDVEYWQDYPDGNLALFWSPYEEPPAAGFFGFAHRTGWKAVGQKIATGELRGDYGSNEEPDVTTWYTRGAPRACDPRPEFYFLADDLIDPVEVPDDLIEDSYEQIGRVTLPNQKQMRIMQQQPTTLALGDLAEAALARRFDRSATPAAFARSARGAVPFEANFANQIRLVGYDLDTRRAHPGGRLPVTLYWQALGPLSTGYQVFTHLENEAGGLIAQADGVPVCWTYPTDLWRPGQIIADQHAITIPPDAPPGVYPLRIGLYVPDTFQRLDILDEVGNPAGTSLPLVEIELTEEIDRQNRE